MKLTSPASGAVMDFDPFSTRTNADPSHNLGELVFLADERNFRYAKVGASNISKGKLQLAPAPKANHANMALAAAAANTFDVTATPGATAVVADEYDEGFLAINDVDGEGQTYKVGSHPASNASTAFAIRLLDPISVALTANSEGSLVHNAHNSVVEAAVTTRRGAGVPLISLLAGDYGWLQTKGVAAVLCDTATTLGAPQGSSASVAGAVSDIDDTLGASSDITIGQADIMAGVDTEYRPITLTID